MGLWSPASVALQLPCEKARAGMHVGLVAVQQLQGQNGVGEACCNTLVLAIEVLCKALCLQDTQQHCHCSWQQSRSSSCSKCALLPRRFCRFRNLAQGNHTTERRDYYTCACRDPATKLHWAPDLLCASGPSAAAQDPAVCRVRKLGGGDWQAGTWVNSTCHISDEPFGQDGAPVGAVYNVGGPHKVQLLCAGPASRRRLAAATDAGGSAGRRALSGGRRLAELHPAKTCERLVLIACLHASQGGSALLGLRAGLAAPAVSTSSAVGRCMVPAAAELAYTALRLSLDPQPYGRLSHGSLPAVDTYFSKPDCPFTCKRAGLRPVTGGSANASRVLCSKTNYLGSMRFYGAIPGAAGR